MAREKGIAAWHALGAAALFVVGSAVVLYALFSPVPRGQGRELRVRLLYQTDLQALQDACADVSRRVVEGDLKPGMYTIRYHPQKEVAGFPQVLLELMPVYVDLEPDGMVVVALMGGLDHYGAVFYPAGYRMQNKPLGNKQIADRLWYYDDGYDEHSDWQERIDSLRPKPGK